MWLQVNPTLLGGEIGLETDTQKIKVGDGESLWSELPYVNTAVGFDLYAGGHGEVRSDVTFSNANGVSFGLDAGVITASVSPNVGAGTAAAITGGLMTVNTSGISISITGGGGGGAGTNTAISTIVGSDLSVGINTSGVTIGYPKWLTTAQPPGAYLTTAGLSQDSSKYAGTSAGIVGGSVTLNTAGVSISLPAYLTTAMASNAGSNFAGLNSGATNCSVTVNSSGVSVNLPAYLTTADLSQNSSKYAGTVSGATNCSVTVNTSGVSVNLPNYLTTAMASNAGSNFAGLNSGATNCSVTVNSSGVSVNLPAYLTTAALSQDSSKYAGLNSGATNCSVTVNTSGVSVNLPAYLTTAMQSASSSVFAKTGFTSTSTAGAAIVATHDTNGLSVGIPNYLTTAALSADSSKYAGTVTGATNCSVTVNTSGVSVNISQPYCGYLEPYPATNTAVYGPVAGSWCFAPFVAPALMSGGRINLLHQNTSTASLFRDITGANYNSNSTGTLQQSYSYAKYVALYSQGSGTNSTRLESFWSNSFSFGWSKDVRVSLSQATNINISVSHSISYISEVGPDGAYTFNQFASNNATSIAGSSTASNWGDSIAASIRNMVSNSIIEPIGFNTTIQPGAYWLAFAWNSTRATFSTGGQLVFANDFAVSGELGISRVILESAYRNWGSTATTARSHIMPYGLYTGATATTPPQYVALSSDLVSLNSMWVPYFNFQLQGITK